MSLGTATIKSVNTSRPSLLHTPSQRSVSAVHDHHPEDHASLLSSGDEPTTVVRYTSAQDPPASSISEETIRPQTAIQAGANDAGVAPTIPSRKSLKERFSSKRTAPMAHLAQWRNSRSEISPPTPGADDRPYIQFAIDQLTRDEELLGRSRDGVYSQDVAPIIGEDALIPEAILHGESSRLAGTHRAPRQSGTPVIDPVDIDPLSKRTGATPPNTLFPGYRSQYKPRLPEPDFIPRPLNPVSLLALLGFCLFMIVGLVVSCVWASKHAGLLSYDGTGTSRYFLFEYLPQLLAAFILLWLLVIQAAFQRILPFMLLRRSTHYDHDVLHDVPSFTTNFLIPDYSCFWHGEPSLGFCATAFWMTLFTVPLLSCVYQTRLDDQGVWMWTVVQPVAWVVIILYFLLGIALVLLAVRVVRRNTGVTWDPRSLADVLVMVRQMNIRAPTIPFSESNLTGGHRPAGLKYWQTPNHSRTAFYTLDRSTLSRPERAPARLQPIKTRHSPLDLESQRLSGRSHLSASNSQSIYIPWFLRETWVLLWIVVAFVLLIAFIAVSYAHSAVATGFLPRLPSTLTNLNFASANFLYSFLPSFLGMLLFLVWLSIDNTFRALEPFAQMANPEGATAEDSLLLDYTAGVPLLVSLTAAFHGHWKVAWFSFVSLIALTIAVLAGGVFTAQFVESQQEVLEQASMPGYIALTVLLIIYALSYLLVWPTQKRYLPHAIKTLGSLWAMMQTSGLLEESSFRGVSSRGLMIVRLEGRFACGTFQRGGKEIWSVERVGEMGEKGVRSKWSW